jgi:hypothetical protein
LLLFGLAFRSQAGLVFIDLVEEIKQIETMPVLIAVDQYNTWDVPSAFVYKSKKLFGRDLCVPHALSFIPLEEADMDAWKLSNVICIAAASQNHHEGRNVTYKKQNHLIPLNLHVPYYSSVEFLSCIVHYMNCGRIRQEININELLAYRMYAGNNPKLIRREISSYFLYTETNHEDKDFISGDKAYEDDCDALDVDLSKLKEAEDMHNPHKQLKVDGNNAPEDENEYEDDNELENYDEYEYEDEYEDGGFVAEDEEVAYEKNEVESIEPISNDKSNNMT